MAASIVSRRRTLAASGVLAAILAGLAVVAIVGAGGQREPTPLPAGERPSPPPATPTPTSQDQADESAAARPQQRDSIGDAQLAAAIDRAEAWATDMLTWRYDESPEQRRQRLAAHLTDERAAEHQGGHGTAELARRREVEWTATGEVTHSYPETIRDDLVVVVVMATEHITTVEGERRKQRALTVEVVPTDEGWRVDGMVF